MLLTTQSRERRAATHSRVLARVGAYYTEASIIAKKDAIDADLLAVDQAQSAYFAKVKAAQADRLAKKQCTGLINPATGWSDCLSSEEISYVQWRAQFTQFQFDWSAYKTLGITVGNSGKLDEFDARLKTLRASFESITSTKLPVPANPDDPSWWTNTGGGGKGGSPSILDTTERLIWIGGVLLIGYFAFAYVLPLFIGAGATTRAARRRYEEA